MRHRRLLATLAAGALVLVFAAPAAAQGPERFPNEPVVLGEEDFAGTCGFPVVLEDTFAAGQTQIFPVDRDGNQRLQTGGGYRSTLTNMTTGATIEITYFGHLEYTYRPDGLLELRTSGQVLHWYTAEDAAFAGLGAAGIYLVTGHSVMLADAATNVLVEPATHRGRVTDICALLGPA